MKLTPRGNPEHISPEITTPYFLQLGRDLEDELDSASPVGESAELSHSWFAQAFVDRVLVRSSAAHARFPEFGTKSPIVPKKEGGHLVFRSRGKLYVLKKVKGQRAQYYVLHALQRMFPGSNIRPK